MPKIPAGYQIGRPRPHELAMLEAIEMEAAVIFSPADLTPGEEGLPLWFFEEASSAGRLWVARTLAPKAPVAFAVAILLDGSAHLYELDVLPSHGRRGLGRALVAHVAEWAQTSGFASLTLTSFRHVAWNAPFYASLGFREILDTELGSELRAILAKEAENGLDPGKRLAMKLELRET